ncbi:MAG: Gfo/Idh/MocA family oxidoreductase [Spirochaetales bacterium]|jgi:predicted dehydrogenase|nr:Gfo/Idh/MocA family oxidoreductase [Spirochaetales bacterium]
MKIRVGVVGAGTYGESLIQAFYGAHMMEEIDFAAVADLNPAALEKMNKLYGLKGYADYKEMFDKESLDAVAVVTPDYLHREITIEAARRKIHILVQKPLATDVREGREMIAAAEENKVMLYVDFHKRFDPGHIQLKQAVQSGKLGEIQYGYICMEDKILVPSVWFKKWARHSSPAWFLGIHFYDLLYWILGKAPVSVYATGIKKKLAAMNIDTYDSLQAKFDYENGASITVDTSWILPNSFCSIVNQQIRLVGSEGIQEVDSQDRGVVAAYESEAANMVINPYGKIIDTRPLVGDIPCGYTIESMVYFLRLIRMVKAGKVKLKDLEGHYPTGKEALVSTQMCAAVHESAGTGKIITIK